MSLLELVAMIAQWRPSPGVWNPWAQRDPLDTAWDGPWARRERLLRHFDCKPKFLLIGEAPGYQGCHFSGVPFTSEKLLCAGAIPRIPKTERITSRDRPWSEPSATVVWRTLHELGIADQVVMWNAYAWHPHGALTPLSNRTPTREELKAGVPVLRAVTYHFLGAPVVAASRQAEWCLKQLGVHVHEVVRHPSMGGARAFREQMGRLAA